MPGYLTWVGLFLSALSILLGLLSRFYLGGSYSSRASHTNVGKLIQAGPYRWIRHPIYSSAVLWIVGWPIIIRSFIGALIAIRFVIPAIMKRIILEEDELLRAFGEEYESYQMKTWRLIPFVY